MRYITLVLILSSKRLLESYSSSHYKIPRVMETATSNHALLRITLQLSTCARGHVQRVPSGGFDLVLVTLDMGRQKQREKGKMTRQTAGW